MQISTLYSFYSTNSPGQKTLGHFLEIKAEPWEGSSHIDSTPPSELFPIPSPLSPYLPAAGVEMHVSPDANNAFVEFLKPSVGVSWVGKVL